MDNANLFDDIGAELVTAQCTNVALELTNDSWALWVSADITRLESRLTLDKTAVELQAVLYNIVGEWILLGASQRRRHLQGPGLLERESDIDR